MTDIWESWVLNTGKFHPSIYTNFNFNSYAAQGNRLFGCKNDGIYEIIGETDDGTEIETRVVLAPNDFGTSRDKRFRRARLAVSGYPSLSVETETGDADKYVLTDGRATISRSVRGKIWTFTVDGFDDLEFIELVSIVLTR